MKTMKRFPVEIDFSSFYYALETDALKVKSILTGKSIRIRKIRISFNAKMTSDMETIFKELRPKMGDGLTYCTWLTRQQMTTLLEMSKL